MDGAGRVRGPAHDRATGDGIGRRPRGGPVRLVDRDGNPGDVGMFEQIVRTNLVGTFRVASIAAAAMASNNLSQGDRGAIVFTASVAAFEGQAGQAGYAASKSGVVGL